MLEGDYTNTPLSDLPFIDGIKSAGKNELTEDGKYKVSVKSCGKNLFNIEASSIINQNIAHKVEKNDNGGYNLTSISDNAGWVYSIIDPKFILKPNTKYVFQCEIKKSNSSSKPLIRLRMGGTDMFIDLYDIGNIAFTTPTNLSNVTMYIYSSIDNVSSLLGDTFEFTNIQIEECDVATDYEPHQETVQEYLLDEPLRGVNSSIYDYLIDGKVVRNVTKIIFDGSDDENWTSTGFGGHATQNTFELFISNGLSEVTNGRAINGISDKFSNALVTGLPGIGQFRISRNTKDYFLFSPSTSLIPYRDLVSWKAWLKLNPITIYYKSANATTETLDSKVLLKSYEGTTHIMSDNLLAPTISCKIPSNVPAVVSSLRMENEGLNNEVETLTLENEGLKETSALQDEAINVSMIATDELYTTLDSIVNPASTIDLLNETNQENKEVDSMVDFYVVMVQRGLKKVENVPERYREQVKAILEELEK